MRRQRLLLFLSAIAAVSLWTYACGDGTTEPTPDPPRPTTVTVSPATAELAALGATVQLSVQVQDQNGQVMSGATVTWASSATAVATVSATGLVTAAGNGTATITATSGEASGSAAVTVAQEVSAVTVTPAEASLAALGDTVRFTAEARDANGNQVAVTEVKWSSGDKAVATVDSTGLVTAVSDGMASVTATLAGVSGSAELTVAQLAVAMRLSPEADTLTAPGGTLHLLAEADDANGHLLGYPRFSWTSSDESVATVDESGLVTAVAEGTVEVTAVEATAGLMRAAVLLVVEPRKDLLALYEALGGSGWTNAANWGTDQPLGTWQGITTDSEGRVTEVDLSDNGLAGEIPPEIGLLVHLEVLDLSGNAVSAAIDPSADQVSLLGPELDLRPDFAPVQYPKLAGRLMYAAQQSSDIEICSAPTGTLTPGHGLTGSIPPELGSLRNLRVLNLSYNSLTGSIPPELGSLAALTRLELHGNSQLTGPIPPELGDLAVLNQLYLYGNNLTGRIPPELGNLIALNSLALSNNDLTGPIPPELGNLVAMVSLSLGDNDLTGPIPPELDTGCPG